jgi:hypothetical protein
VDFEIKRRDGECVKSLIIEHALSGLRSQDHLRETTALRRVARLAHKIITG